MNDKLKHAAEECIRRLKGKIPITLEETDGHSSAKITPGIIGLFRAYGIIALNPKEVYTLRDLAFVLAHEARHIWQFDRLGLDTLMAYSADANDLGKLGLYRYATMEHDADLYGLEFLEKYPEFDSDEVVNPEGDKDFIPNIIEICKNIKLLFTVGRLLYDDAYFLLSSTDNRLVTSRCGAAILAQLRPL